MIRRALATFTVSLAVVSTFAQSTDKACQSSTAKKPSAAVTSAKVKPAVHTAKPFAATSTPRKASAVLPVAAKAPSVPKPLLVRPYVATVGAPLSAPPLIAPVITPHPRDLSVHPNLEFVPTSNVVVRDMHLRPLFTSTIHVGELVTSLVVGAPTLFEVEHKDTEPNLIFVKPSTHLAAESNLLIALASGETISIRLISPGDAGYWGLPVGTLLNRRKRMLVRLTLASPSVLIRRSPLLDTQLARPLRRTRPLTSTRTPLSIINS
jgi:hypothetical protein